MKNTKKTMSVFLAAAMLVSATAVAAVSASAATGTLSSHYATNPDGKVGVQKTITVDGTISDWNSSMLIAQGTANDDPRVYRPSSMHEKPFDLYALYGAYDDSNLYLMWEMTNVQDIVAPSDDYPLSQGVLYQTENVPFHLAIDTGKSDVIGNNGKTSSGGTHWDSGMTFGNGFNRMVSFSTNGSNGPFIYSGDTSGLNPVEIFSGSTTGINLKWGLGINSTSIWGIDKGYGTYNNRVPGDVCNESAAWVDFMTKGHKSSTMDFHYEMSIPLSKLGITKSDITSNGIGVLLVSTYGKSGMDCLPYDLSMNDNADQPDTGSQPVNSLEKSDDDYITASFARIGASGGSTSQPTDPPTQPTDPPTQPTDPPTQPTQPTQPTDPPATTLTVNSLSNYFNSSVVSDLSVGDTVTVRYDLNANMGVCSAQWKLAYDSSKLRLKTPAESICPMGGEINATGNSIIGNFTNASDFYDFNGGKTFVQAEFEVIGTGSTNVTMTVQELNLAYKKNGMLNIASVVENGQVQNVNNVSGFETASVTPSAVASSSAVPVVNGLAVNATSNFFRAASATLNEDASQLTVTYRLQSSVKVIDAQWALRYDTAKLRLVSAVMPKAPKFMGAEPATGVKTGNTASTTLMDYTTMDDFIVATFDVIGSGSTTVNLKMMNLGVAKLSGSTANIAYVVDEGYVTDITSQTGFGNYTYTAKTVIGSDSMTKRGDLTGDSAVSIEDATLIQRYLAEFITLTDKQLLAADANHDGVVNVKDVTAIQRAVAQLQDLDD